MMAALKCGQARHFIHGTTAHTQPVKVSKIPVPILSVETFR